MRLLQPPLKSLMRIIDEFWKSQDDETEDDGSNMEDDSCDIVVEKPSRSKVECSIDVLKDLAMCCEKGVFFIFLKIRFLLKNPVFVNFSLSRTFSISNKFSSPLQFEIERVNCTSF